MLLRVPATPPESATWVNCMLMEVWMPFITPLVLKDNLSAWQVRSKGLGRANGRAWEGRWEGVDCMLMEVWMPLMTHLVLKGSRAHGFLQDEILSPPRAATLRSPVHDRSYPSRTGVPLLPSSHQ